MRARVHANEFLNIIETVQIIVQNLAQTSFRLSPVSFHAPWLDRLFANGKLFQYGVIIQSSILGPFISFEKNEAPGACTIKLFTAVIYGFS